MSDSQAVTIEIRAALTPIAAPAREASVSHRRLTWDVIIKGKEDTLAYESNDEPGLGRMGKNVDPGVDGRTRAWWA